MSSSDLSICVPEKNRTVGPWGFQTPFQTNHPEFGAGEAPPNFPVKETGFAFCTFRNPKPNLPGSSQLRFGGFFVQDTRYCHHQSAPNRLEVTRHLRQKSRLKKLGQVSDSYHEYVSSHMCEKKRTPIVLGMSHSSRPLKIRNLLINGALYAPILSFGLMSLSPICMEIIGVDRPPAHMARVPRRMKPSLKEVHSNKFPETNVGAKKWCAQV